MSAVNSQWSIDEPYWNLLNASVRPGSEGSRRFDPRGGNLGSVPKNGQIHTEFWAVISGPADIGRGLGDWDFGSLTRVRSRCAGIRRASRAGGLTRVSRHHVVIGTYINPFKVLGP